MIQGRMSRNKDLRGKIAGHKRMVLEHREKVEKELRSDNPNRDVIALWQKRIQIVEEEILHLEKKLRRH